MHGKPNNLHLCGLQDKIYLGYMLAVHAGALLAPFTFSWANFACFMGMVSPAPGSQGGPPPTFRRLLLPPGVRAPLLGAAQPCPAACGPPPLCTCANALRAASPLPLCRPQYFITGCLGITLSYHRQLSHRSFTTPKWVEYILAYCGVMSVQGDPMVRLAATAQSAPCSSTHASVRLCAARAALVAGSDPPVPALALIRRLLRCLASTGVGVVPPLPPPALRDAAGPPLRVRGLLVEPHGLAAG